MGKMVDRLVVASGSPLNTQQTLEKWERFQEAAHIVHTLLKSHGISSKSEMHEADFKLKLEIDEALKSTLKDRAGRALFLSNLGKSKLKSLMNNPDMGIFPNSHFVKIPGAGHWVHLEKTDDFLS